MSFSDSYAGIVMAGGGPDPGCVVCVCVRGVCVCDIFTNHSYNW